MKYARYFLITVSVIFALLLGASYYMLRYALDSRREAWTDEQAWSNLYEHYPFATDWFDSIRADGVLRDTFIVSDDGRRLHAYYLPAASERTALLVHGYGNRAIDMLSLGYMYHHDLGCNILLPDLHGHGHSDGNDIRMGWLDRLDVLRWSQVADSLFHAHIVVHGISMGAATTMMLSGEDSLPEYITHFVEDCGYTSVEDEFEGEMVKQFSIPAFPLLPMASAMCKVLRSWSFSEASALNQVAHCRRPMFFIHGDSDTYVPTCMVYSLYKAHPGPKQLWITKGARHAVSYEMYPMEYMQKVKTFLDKY